MWIRLAAPWTWKPSPQSAIAYPAGDHNVPRACADAALAKGVAVRVVRKSKDDAVEVEDGGS